MRADRNLANALMANNISQRRDKQANQQNKERAEENQKELEERLKQGRQDVLISKNIKHLKEAE